MKKLFIIISMFLIILLVGCSNNSNKLKDNQSIVVYTEKNDYYFYNDVLAIYKLEEILETGYIYTFETYQKVIYYNIYQNTLSVTVTYKLTSQEKEVFSEYRLGGNQMAFESEKYYIYFVSLEIKEAYQGEKK